MATPRVRFRNITATAPSHRALTDVSFELAPATIHALVGDGGSGKSIITGILAGTIHADSGVIEINGAPQRIRDPRHARDLGIAVASRGIVDDLSIAANVFLGHWPRRRVTRVIDFPRMHSAARDALATLGVELPVTQPARGLPAAQRQLVAVARAFASGADVLVLDEPAAGLAPDHVAALHRAIAAARDRGATILYITRRVDEVLTLARTVTILRAGRTVLTAPIADVTREQVLREITGGPRTMEFPKRESAPGPPAVRVRGLAVRDRVHAVSFDLRAGEVLGLTGYAGSGCSALARALVGDLRASAGEITIGDATGLFRKPRRALAAGMMLVPAERIRTGLSLDRPIRENLSLAAHDQLPTGGLVTRRAERDLALRLLAELSILSAGPDCLAGPLAAVDQQKILFGRFLASRARILILDDPTRGLDAASRHEIYMLINQLVAQAVAVLMISPDPAELLGTCDRIAVMHAGCLAGILDNTNRDVTPTHVAQLAQGAEA